MAVTMRRALFLLAALLLASSTSPVTAGQWRAHYGDWWAIHQAIYERENRIALLEANPETDDGYRAPIISRHRAEIRRLHAALGPAQWQWTSPCCYGRPPIYIGSSSHRRYPRY
jgi:hypothetical protein